MTSRTPTDSAGAIRLLGLLIERKTDVLAATAFLLALIGAAFQAAAFLRGAEVSLYPPEDVVFLFDTYPTGESVFRIAASMSYTNSGAAGHDAVVQRETVSFMLGDEPREQAWQSFQKLQRRGHVLTVVDTEIAGPVPIVAGSGKSHPTTFAPRRRRCPSSDTDCATDEDFIDDGEFLRQVVDQETLVLDFEAHLLGRSKPLRESCTIDIDDRLILALMANRWHAAPCWPT